MLETPTPRWPLLHSQLQPWAQAARLLVPPFALVEAVYLSNPPEAELMADPAVQRVEAEAIAARIVRHLTTDDPGSGHNGVSRTSRVLTTGRRSGCVDPRLEP